MSSGSERYKGINRARALGLAPLSGAAARNQARSQAGGTVFQTADPNAPNFSPF